MRKPRVSKAAKCRMQVAASVTTWWQDINVLRLRAFVADDTHEAHLCKCDTGGKQQVNRRMRRSVGKRRWQRRQEAKEQKRHEEERGLIFMQRSHAAHQCPPK